jgi:hypothetical protein
LKRLCGAGVALWVGEEKMKKIIFVAAMSVFGFAACKKKLPENIPRPKAGDAVEAAAVSTGAVKTTSLLAAPGIYLRNTVGQVGKAKAAAVIYEKAAVENMAVPGGD